jgi:hypothetical protein
MSKCRLLEQFVVNAFGLLVAGGFVAETAAAQVEAQRSLPSRQEDSETKGPIPIVQVKETF